MFPAPRTFSICLALLCGTTCLLCAQTAPVLTPGSVLYLKERVAVKTKTGIIGPDPGAGVRLVSENRNAVTVTDGTTTFDVSKDKLTANVNEANVAAQNYYVTQQAGAEAFNAEVVRQQQERKRALDQQVAAAAEHRQREIHQEQNAAQQQRMLGQAQQMLGHAPQIMQAAQRGAFSLAAPPLAKSPAPNPSAAQEAAWNAQQAAQARRRQQADVEISQLELDWSTNPRSLIKNRSGPSSGYIDTANDPILQNRLDNLNSAIEAERSFQRSKNSITIGR